MRETRSDLATYVRTNYGFIIYNVTNFQITSTLLILYSQDDNITSDALYIYMYWLGLNGDGLPAGSAVRG